MIKVKMIELLNSYESLRNVGNINTFSTPIQFKFKTSLLIKDINGYIDLYNKQLQSLIDLYNIKIKDNRFACDDGADKLKEFLIKKIELEEMDIEINHEKIIFSKSINNVSANDLLNLSPFFDFSELELE